MLLLLAVLAGLIAGLARTWIRKQAYQPIRLKYSWLVLAGFIPQVAAFSIPGIRSAISEDSVRYLFFGSQVFFLVFIVLNLHQPGMLLIGSGLICNMLVIYANGGLMPISPDTVKIIFPNVPVESIQIGARLGWSKDIVLAEEDIRLSWLRDHFVTPTLAGTKFAFSFGDILIAAGVFYLLWNFGEAIKPI